MHKGRLIHTPSIFKMLLVIQTPSVKYEVKLLSDDNNLSMEGVYFIYVIIPVSYILFMTMTMSDQYGYYAENVCPSEQKSVYANTAHILDMR
jgi:hypothetical protein